MSSVIKFIISLFANIFEHKVKKIGPVDLKGFGDRVTDELQSGYYDEVLFAIEEETKRKFNNFINLISDKVKIIYHGRQPIISTPTTDIPVPIAIPTAPPHEPNIQIPKLEECHICMNKLANTETSCHHWVCYACWNTMNINRHDQYVKCPFCRQNVIDITIYPET